MFTGIIFKQLLKEKYDVIFLPNADYTGIAAEKVAGSITCDGYNTIIEYNDTYTQTTERKHYTIVHEGVHFYCDLNKGQTSKSIMILQIILWFSLQTMQ